VDALLSSAAQLQGKVGVFTTGSWIDASAAVQQI
jgi:hypothetical protein